jgi:hypothetical protein
MATISLAAETGGADSASEKVVAGSPRIDSTTLKVRP